MDHTLRKPLYHFLNKVIIHAPLRQFLLCPLIVLFFHSLLDKLRSVGVLTVAPGLVSQSQPRTCLNFSECYVVNSLANRVQNDALSLPCSLLKSLVLQHCPISLFSSRNAPNTTTDRGINVTYRCHYHRHYYQ